MPIIATVDETGAVSGTVTDSQGNGLKSVPVNVSGDIYTDQYFLNPHPGVVTGSAGEFSFYAKPGSLSISVDWSPPETPQGPEPITLDIVESAHIAGVLNQQIGTPQSSASPSAPGQDTAATGSEPVGAPDVAEPVVPASTDAGTSPVDPNAPAAPTTWTDPNAPAPAAAPGEQVNPPAGEANQLDSTQPPA